MPQKTVFFHGHCPDGIAAAWVVWKLYPDAKFVMMGYETPVKYEELADRDVIAVDFSFKPEVMALIAKQAKSILVIDHHQTVTEYSPEYTKIKHPSLVVHVDITKCGAVLAWEHFFPDIPMPLLLNYVQDRDLWRWKLPDSNAVSAWLQSKNWQRPEMFEGYVRALAKDYISCVEAGEAVLQVTDKQIDKICLNAIEMTLDGNKAWSVQTPILISEVANHLLKEKQTGLAVIWYEGKEKVHVSLRSLPGGVDVSAIAQKYGGGGHKSAAGFELPITNDVGLRKALTDMGFPKELFDYYMSNPVQRAEAVETLRGLMLATKASQTVGKPYGGPVPGTPLTRHDSSVCIERGRLPDTGGA